jgi:hypothetical protein
MRRAPPAQSRALVNQQAVRLAFPLLLYPASMQPTLRVRAEGRKALRSGVGFARLEPQKRGLPVRQGPFQCSSTLGKRVGGEVTDERRQMGGRSLQCSRARPADGVLVPSRSNYFAIPRIAPTHTVSRLCGSHNDGSMRGSRGPRGSCRQAHHRFS